MRSLIGSLALMAILWTLPVVAEPTQVELINVTWQAPVSCPSAELFYDSIRARTAKFQLVTAEQASQRFEISVRDDGERFVGALIVHTPARASERRELSAQSCEEVLETFALIVAVAIDPQARLNPQSAPPAQPIAAPEGPPQPPPAAPVKIEAAAETPRRSDIPSSPPKDSPPVLRVEEPAWVWIGGAGVEAHGGVAPQIGMVGQVWIEILREKTSSFGFLGRLSLMRGFPAAVAHETAREVTFTWTAARAELGVLAWGRAGFAIETSLGIDVGFVDASASQAIEGARTEVRPWVAPVALGRVRWVPVDPLSLEVFGGASLPLVRDKYRLLGPDEPIYQAPFVAGLFGGTIGVRFD